MQNASMASSNDQNGSNNQRESGVPIQEAWVAREKFEGGTAAFGMLFSRWMDTNNWSHPIMTNLAKSCLGGMSWLHSSQISGFRHGKLESPGPRVFVAIERLNYHLHVYETEKKLIPGTSSSNFYSTPFVIRENGEPPSLGWWVEVFCGYRVPKDIDLKVAAFTPGEAERLSRNWGKLVRRLLVNAGYDLITDLEAALHRLYPARDEDRVADHLAVIRAQKVWTSDQLANELPAITSMSAALKGPETEEELVERLKAAA